MIGARLIVVINVLVAVLLAGACNQTRELTRQNAARLIEGSDLFKGQKTAKFFTGQLCNWQKEFRQMLEKPRPLRGTEFNPWVVITSAARAVGWIELTVKERGCGRLSNKLYVSVCRFSRNGRAGAPR